MASIKTVRDHLAEHPFFAGMAPSYVDLIAGCGRLAHYNAGTFLMKEGDKAGDFYLVRRGRAAVEIHAPARGPLTIAHASEGSVIGFSWLFPPHHVAFDVHASTPMDVIALDGACLRGKADSDHELGYQLMSRFSRLLLELLNATRHQLLDVYGGTDVAARHR